ncbi:hypothetical protein AFL40_4016 [Mycobacterium tuberculosis]|nr:hypothetical protein AFL40_4016 [Mycobacterium tuberculosis]AOZ45273.1 hypothetical protein BTB1458_4277 [Mycobacterium tuberculosis]
MPVELSDRRSVAVRTNPVPRSRMGRIAWSWFRHPVKSHEFPAKNERLITTEELLRFAV